MILTKDYDYYLPKELIAQTPLENRSESRLMILNRKNKTIEHKHFSDIVDYLDENDVLVLNDTKVIPARLYGHKEDTNALIEILLLHDKGNNVWQTLAKPQRRVKIGSIISFGDGRLKAKCVKKEDMGICEFELIYDGILVEILDSLGEMPLPPYIHEKLADKDRYQTVYAKNPGSAAAPTAGLHFTPELLKKIEKKVWNVRCRETDVGFFSEHLRIIGISKCTEDLVDLRVISDRKPTTHAVNVIPALEDYYLYTFADTESREVVHAASG